MTGGFPSQKANNMINVFIRWRHHRTQKLNASEDRQDTMTESAEGHQVVTQIQTLFTRGYGHIKH